MLATDERESDVFDMRFRTADGKELIAALNFTIVSDEGTYSGIVGVARDVTERRRRERELHRQRERLSEFADMVAHDLRNPLTLLDGSLELAAETGDPDHFEQCREAIDRMERLIDDLLDLARQGETVGEPEPVALASADAACWGERRDGAGRSLDRHRSGRRGGRESPPPATGERFP